MTDIALVLAADGQSCDLAVQSGDLQLDDTLRTAVLHSLMAAGRWQNGDPLPANGDKGGWWGDAYLAPLPDGSPDHWGARLPFYRRLTATPANANRLCAVVQDALAWLLTDGVAADVSVSGTFSSNSQFNFVTQMSRTGLAGTASATYNYTWDVQLGQIVPYSSEP